MQQLLHALVFGILFTIPEPATSEKAVRLHENSTNKDRAINLTRRYFIERLKSDNESTDTRPAYTKWLQLNGTKHESLLNSPHFYDILKTDVRKIIRSNDTNIFNVRHKAIVPTNAEERVSSSFLRIHRTANRPDPKQKNGSTDRDRRHRHSKRVDITEPVNYLLPPPPFTQWKKYYKKIQTAPTITLNSSHFYSDQPYGNNTTETKEKEQTLSFILLPPAIKSVTTKDHNVYVTPKITRKSQMVLPVTATNTDDTAATNYAIDNSTIYETIPSHTTDATNYRVQEIRFTASVTQSIQKLKNISSNYYLPDTVTNKLTEVPLLSPDVEKAGMKVEKINASAMLGTSGRDDNLSIDSGYSKRSDSKKITLNEESGTSTPDEYLQLSVAETMHYKTPSRQAYIEYELDRVIPGAAGQDYPTLSKPPINSRFSCKNDSRRYIADVSTGCQVFFMCVGDGPGEAMLCPNGTLFHQDFLVCDWWYNVDCRQ